MSKADITRKLDEMEAKLDDTVAGVDRGPVKDAMRLVVPMMKDQIEVLRLMLNELTA